MFENKWGLRLIALAFAILFFLSVNNVFGNVFNADKFSQNSTETIHDVPVEVKYNQHALYVSGAPEKVDVELSGTRSQVLKADKNEDVKAVLDLRNEKAGKHTTSLQLQGLSDDIDYEIKPKEVTVDLQEKVTKKMKVEPDVSESNVGNDNKISEQSVSPDHVKVTGGQEQIDKIAYLKATYKNTSPITNDTDDVATITAFDSNLNKVDVSIEPKTVNLKVSLEPYSKKVKVKPKLVGKVDKDRKLDHVKLDDEEVELYGSKEDLKDIEEIPAEIDLDGVSEDTEKTVELKLPKGIKKVDPNQTKAKIVLK